MALIFLYFIGVLGVFSVFPIYYLLRTNMELWNCNSIEEQAKEAAVVCSWFWIVTLPAVTFKIVFHKIDMLIRRAM